MNKQLLGKIGPILGLIVSLSTTSFAGYKIFAASPEHNVAVPSLPSQTQSVSLEPKEAAEPMLDDVSTGVVIRATPTPTGIPSFTGTLGKSDEFDDGDDDRISVESHQSFESEKKEVEHESTESEDASDR